MARVYGTAMACWSCTFLHLLPFLHVNKSYADTWLGFTEWKWIVGYVGTIEANVLPLHCD